LPAGGTEAVGAARALRGAGFAGPCWARACGTTRRCWARRRWRAGCTRHRTRRGGLRLRPGTPRCTARPPPRLATLAYDAVALAAALARTAEPKADPFAAARLTDPSGFAGLDGLFRFGPDGVAERGLAILEIRSGRAFVAEPGPAAF
jgi:hypothetical protein